MIINFTNSKHISGERYEGFNSWTVYFVICVQFSYPQDSILVSSSGTEEQIMKLSKEKWGWMSERKTDSLAVLFHEKAVFVHMGGTGTIVAFSHTFWSVRKKIRLYTLVPSGT